jgi:hypothetical protein
MSILKTILIIAAILLVGVSVSAIVLLLVGIVTVPGVFGTTIFWVVAESVATIVFTAVAVVNMIELRRSRLELVHPRLSLEPAFFEYDVKTGNITGFSSLNLVNGGTVARDIEIDFSCQGKTDFLYTSSLGTDDRVQIWTGKFAELGNNAIVDVKYRDMYNQALHEVLSINIESINSKKRRIVPVHSKAKVVTDRVES